MAQSMNHVMLIGNIGQPIELKQTQGGDPFCGFRLAVTTTWTGQNGKQERTDWVNILAFRQSAQFAAQYLSKGMRVAIYGRIQTREFTDRAGNKREITEVNANQFVPMSTPQNAPQGQPQGGGYGGGAAHGGGYGQPQGQPQGGGGFDAPPGGGHPGRPASQGGNFPDDDIPF